MATDLENLLTYRSNLLAELAALDPQASYRIDGQAVDHNGYRRSLEEALERIEKRITALEGPVERELRGTT